MVSAYFWHEYCLRIGRCEVPIKITSGMTSGPTTEMSGTRLTFYVSSHRQWGFC